jgi:hypothetical protein
LYEPSHDRVGRILRSLGGQKRGKYSDPQIDKWMKALSFYNERIKFIKEGLDQQRVQYYSSCDQLIQRLMWY